MGEGEDVGNENGCIWWWIHSKDYIDRINEKNIKETNYCKVCGEKLEIIKEIKVNGRFMREMGIKGYEDIFLQDGNTFSNGRGVRILQR